MGLASEQVSWGGGSRLPSSSPASRCRGGHSGGCRQKLREFARDDTPVVIADEHAVTLRTTLGALLPHSFGPEHLKVGEP